MKRRTLHHYSQLNVYQFVTFRTLDSASDFLRSVKQEKCLNISQKQMKMDGYCDQSNKGCYLNGEVIEVVMNHIRQLDPGYFVLIAVSVMPNHVHLLFQQKQSLQKIMQHVKGATALLVNKTLSKQGDLWERGYFDKAIRDERHFLLTYEYIKNNAVKVNLKDANQRFYGVYES